MQEISDKTENVRGNLLLLLLRCQSVIIACEMTVGHVSEVDRRLVNVVGNHQVADFVAWAWQGDDATIFGDRKEMLREAVSQGGNEVIANHEA